jgi:pilus assembly protein CpaE
MTNLVAVMRTKEAANHLQEAAEGLADTNVDVIVSSIENLEQNPRAMNGHDVLLIDVVPSNSVETEHLKRFIDSHHQTRPVIVTSPEVSREAVQRILESGATEILAQPIRQVDLVIAMDQAVSRHAAMTLTEAGPAPSKGKVISFLKGGGGAGATTLALQLGGLMASNKTDPCEVCLIDFDVQWGAVGLYLDIQKDASLSDLITSPDRLDEALLLGVMLQHNTGLHVLRGPDELLPLEAMSVDFVTNLIALARATYDYVLIDLPQAWTEWSFATLGQSDLVMLVTQLNVGSIRQTDRQLDALRTHELGDVPVKLVLNRHAGGGKFSDYAAEVSDAETALGHKFDFLLPNAYEITQAAINRGLMITDVRRRSKLEKTIQSIGDDIRKALSEDSQVMEGAVAK